MNEKSGIRSNISCETFMYLAINRLNSMLKGAEVVSICFSVSSGLSLDSSYEAALTLCSSSPSSSIDLSSSYLTSFIFGAGAASPRTLQVELTGVVPGLPFVQYEQQPFIPLLYNSKPHEVFHHMMKAFDSSFFHTGLSFFTSSDFL